MIDYGMGKTNIDTETGIRYGVIHQNLVLQAWCDSSEAYYGDPHCPKCGDAALEADEVSTDVERNEINREEYEVRRGACGDYACDTCKLRFDADEAFGDEPLSHFLDDGEYKAECGEDGDIFITKSPYFTYGPYCSPCAPGAVYLADAGMYNMMTGVKAYCFSHDFFDGGKAPYKVYSVATGEEV